MTEVNWGLTLLTLLFKVLTPAERLSYYDNFDRVYLTDAKQTFIEIVRLLHGIPLGRAFLIGESPAAPLSRSSETTEGSSSSRSPQCPAS